MIQTQRPPRVTLPGLNHHVRPGQSGLKSKLLEFFPVFLAAVISTHIIQIGCSYFRFIFPTISGVDHPLYSGSVTAIRTPEDPES